MDISDDPNKSSPSNPHHQKMKMMNSSKTKTSSNKKSRWIFFVIPEPSSGYLPQPGVIILPTQTMHLLKGKSLKITIALYCHRFHPKWVPFNDPQTNTDHPPFFWFKKTFPTCTSSFRSTKRRHWDYRCWCESARPVLLLSERMTVSALALLWRWKLLWKKLLLLLFRPNNNRLWAFVKQWDQYNSICWIWSENRHRWTNVHGLLGYIWYGNLKRVIVKNFFETKPFMRTGERNDSLMFVSHQK